MDDSKVVERFQNGLKVVIDSYQSKISDLESEIKDLKSENRRLKSKILDYEARVNCLITICVENGIILKDIS